MAGTTTILFTDLTDSTGAMVRLGDDESSAVFGAHLVLLRMEVERHGGRVVKSLGDGIMALFESAYDGVRAAVAMQQAVDVAGRRETDAPSPALGLRVGVNVGEVVAEGDDVFGVAVVVASRLCAAASAGQILVSDLVRLLLTSRTEVEIESVGPMALKGLPEPVAAATVAWEPLPLEQPLRVIVADDAALIRAGVVRLLADGGFVVVAEAADADELLAAVDADPPDLVVTDIRMPPTNTDEGLRAAAVIRERHPATAVLVLSQHVEAGAAATLLEGDPSGVGYVLKERVSELDEFLAAARTVAGGGSVIDPLVAEQLLRRRRHDTAVARLTERERDVLALMAQGRSNAAIRDELAMSAKTVETHVRSIFQKLDLEENPDDNRRVQAVVRWLQPG